MRHHISAWATAAYLFLGAYPFELLESSAAGGDMPAERSSTSVSFKMQVQPIFDANCVVCHQTGGAQEDLVLEEGKSYANLVGKPSHQAPLMLVTPGSLDSSYLLRKLAGTHIAANGRGARMPLAGQLDAQEIAIIAAWVAAGAKDN
jgi:mono/diheme cytochrome c family protein